MISYGRMLQTQPETWSTQLWNYMQLDARNLSQDLSFFVSNSASSHKWRKPEHPAIKCNLDATLNQQQNSTDAKAVVDTVHSSKVHNSEFGSLINCYRTLLAKDNTYSLRFFRRQADKVARALVKAACSYASPSI
ncbi:hypothetical protein DITRI_Ditri06bG0169900 [Diplodiscus trichospermus]